MANFSSSFCTLTITHPNPTVVREFISTFLQSWSDDAGSGAYGPYICDIPELTKENTPSTLQLDFEGTGRWTFANTLSRLKDYMDYYLSLEQKIHFLSLATPIELEWDYVDEECGCQVLYSATGTHAIGQCNVAYDNNIQMSYPYTLENLLELGFNEESYSEYFDEQ